MFLPENILYFKTYAENAGSHMKPRRDEAWSGNLTVESGRVEIFVCHLGLKGSCYQTVDGVGQTAILLKLEEKLIHWDILCGRTYLGHTVSVFWGLSS